MGNLTRGIVERRKRKAGDARERVVVSRQHIQNIYTREREQIKDIKKQLTKLQMEGEILYNSGVNADDDRLTDLSDAMDALETQLQFQDTSTDIFRSTLMVLTELHFIIDVIYKHEMYKFILAGVPYKKIHTLITGDNADLKAVLAVVEKANEKLSEKFMSALTTEEERLKYKQIFADKKASIKMMYGKSADSTASSDAAERNSARFGKKADSEVQGVLPVDINNNNTNTNINRA